MNFTNGKQLLELCEKNQLSISQIMFRREKDYLEQDPILITQKMEHAYNIMKHSIYRALNEDLVGMGGMMAAKANN